ncbi:hypothetical protein [Roseobacter fucihabitans]|nr:hypothetical protein [Roseobacter litoralis]
MTVLRSYLIVVAFSCLATALALDVFRMQDFNVPFHYLTDRSIFIWHNFDVNLYFAYAKGIDEGTGAGDLARLAGGAGVVARDYPVPLFQPLIYALLALFTRFTDWGGALNVLYLMGFPAIALTANIALRERGIAPAIAGALAILYALLPFHTYSGQMHIALSFYFAIPLVVMVACWIGEGRLDSDPKLVVPWGLLAGFLAATTDPYYGFFGAMTLFFAGLYRLSQARANRHWKSITLISLLVAFPVAVIGFLGWDAILNGNGVGAERLWQHAEFWGLKPIQLILPIRDHFSGTFRDLSRQYNDIYPSAHINESVSLGLIGTVGLILLLWGKLADTLVPRLRVPGALMLAYLLYASAASLGLFFALQGLMVFRSLYRFAPFIGFIALIPVGLLASQWWARAPRRKLAWGVLILVSIVALADVTGKQSRPQFDEIKEAYQSDSAYFAALEGALAPGTRILQLPHGRFPEGGSVGRIQMYEQFVPYLHTQTMLFSYGARPDSELGQQLEALDATPAADLAEAVCAAGFEAILLDRRGYLPTIHLNRQVNFASVGDVMNAQPEPRYTAIEAVLEGTALTDVQSPRYALYAPCQG